MELTCDKIREKYTLENLQNRYNDGELVEALEKEIIETQNELFANLTKENIELRYENAENEKDEDTLTREKDAIQEEISVNLYLEGLLPLRGKLLAENKDDKPLKNFDINLLTKLKKAKKDKYNLRPSAFPLYSAEEIEEEILLRIEKAYGFENIPKDLIEKLERSESISLLNFIRILQVLKCEQELESILRDPLESPINRELTAEQKQKIRDASPEDIIKVMYMLF